MPPLKASSLGLQKPNRKREKAKRKKEAKTKHEIWREAVIEKGRTRLTDWMGEPLFRCFHCEDLFPRNEICADHWPETKGSNPKRRYDIENGQPSCLYCNTSGSPDRKRSP